MKRIIFILLTVALFGCHNDIWEELNKHAQKLQELEEYCNKMNDNIIALQKAVEALEKKDFVNSVTPITENGVEVGYTIEFAQTGPATIYHGINGIDGVDGADGHNPVVGAKLDTDGIYYWTLDGEWLLDEAGQKIKAVGIDGVDGEDGKDGADGADGADGKDGVNGKDAVTPQLKIEDDYWYISYDNGTTWTKLEKAVGEDGVAVDGIFESVEQDEQFVYLKLKGGDRFVFQKYGKASELLSLTFKAKQNPSVLIEDAVCAIVDNVCEVMIPHIVPNKKLIPVFDFIGESVVVENAKIESGKTQLDFSKPVVFKVVSSRNDTTAYTVNVRAFTGLPVVTINTNDGSSVTSKSTYKDAYVKIVEDITTKASGDVFESAVKIKGRGNSTWAEKKKPYKLKFDSKVSLFGGAKDKEWILLANHLDCSFLRNKTAMYLGEKSCFAYTTDLHYVELIMNNIYLGTYQVADQQKISEGRVNVTDDGYLIEVDAKAEAEDITFRINTIPQPLNVKDSNIETVGDESYNYIVNFMTTVENTLYGAEWLDPENGWQKYMDMDSFVDWYLINEIARNNDAVFFTSCFMNHAPGGKLFMGPLWDYDLAFGNYAGANSKAEGFYIKDNIGWYQRLFTDPAFVQRVKERFAYFYSLKSEVMSMINEHAEYLELSAMENNNKWGILYNPHSYGYMIPGSYYNEVNYLKQWLNDRLEWMNTAISQL